jgi:pyruvate dehydrogenase (quinone)
VILTADSGSAANWFARDLRLRSNMMASISGSLATMGCAVPYAVGAKFAHPDRPVIALVGDGAMQMNGNAELPQEWWLLWAQPRWMIALFSAVTTWSM